MCSFSVNLTVNIHLKALIWLVEEIYSLKNFGKLQHLLFIIISYYTPSHGHELHLFINLKSLVPFFFWYSFRKMFRLFAKE